MARLLCETHGQEEEAETIRDQDKHRAANECILVVRGKLISGPWHCDRCNRELRAGATAYLRTGLPQWVADGLIDYDFGYEREYFAMGKADTANVYGADWADDSIRRRRRLDRTARRTMSRPICALDIKPK
jgi:hypothetical protein